MFARNFERWDLLLGWFVFGVSWLVYDMTIEPTVSFWDAGEYIATSAKLQIAHPPGAPLLQMIGSFFALFAKDPGDVAKMVNYVSVVSSAFTIQFLFWTITNLARKLDEKNRELTNEGAILLLGSGLVGALTFTFSDSFWFNATETEVYSMASFVMALLLWLGIKWTDRLGDPRGNKWFVLICFVIGLTFGVQFMGFLAIPSIGLLYYFRRYKTISLGNFLVANVLAVAILILVFKFSLTYMLKFFAWGEVFLVNTFGLPFNWGSVVTGLLVVLLFYFALGHTRKKGYTAANTILLGITFLLLGFSSWLMLPIRANAHVVINEGNPSDARSLLAYYNREQYPSSDSPFYGAYYSDMFSDGGTRKDDRPKYERDKALGKYVVVNHYKDVHLGSDKKHTGFLPRMWSTQNAVNYIRFYGGLDFKVRPSYRSDKGLQTAIQQFRTKEAAGNITAEHYVDFLKGVSEYVEVEPPSLWANIRYMVHFQFGYMYFRYLMWNFVGKQNDVQGKFDGNGEWISGIGAIDSLRLGSQENLPSEVRNNKGRNTYFFLPLLLGIIGLVFQIGKDPRQFWVLFVFFVFTGLAIQFYTNPAIFQPRERDYSLVGSFYIFALWAGLGVYGMYDALTKWFAPKILLSVLLPVCLFSVPGIMAHQNWDDHDRSNRYTALSMAKAYLDSTQEATGSILFTIGDIDTFPLWYAQEIEGYRADTRIVISAYLNFYWYIDQMKRKAHDSGPIPSQLTHDLYRYGSRDIVYHHALTDKRWDIKDFMNWVGSDRPETKIKSLLEKQGMDTSNYSEGYLDMVFYPTNKIRIPVNKEKVIESGLVKESEAVLVVDHIDIDLPENGIRKSSLIMLDIIANNDWERPIYFSGGSFEEEEYIWMGDYLQLDGLVYKLVPIKTENPNAFEKGRIDSDLMYRIVKKWDWGNSGDPNIYHDPQTRRQGISFRANIARLVEKLLMEDQPERAREMIDIAMQNMPVDHFGYFALLEPFVDGYYKVGGGMEARALYIKLRTVYQEQLAYYAHLPLWEQNENLEGIITQIRAYQRIIDLLVHNRDTDFAEQEILIFNGYVDRFKKLLDSG